MVALNNACSVPEGDLIFSLTFVSESKKTIAVLTTKYDSRDASRPHHRATYDTTTKPSPACAVSVLFWEGFGENADEAWTS